MSCNRVKYIPVYLGRPSRKGHGVGAIFKGWLNRTIPIIKSKVGTMAEKVGKEVAEVALDSAYTASKDMLRSSKGRPTYNQVDDENFTKPLSRQPKKAIKRKNHSKSISRIRNAKRKRANSDLRGFRKVTL